MTINVVRCNNSPKLPSLRSFFTKNSPLSIISSPSPMDALLAEVASLRAELALLRQTRKQPCQGVTGKGTPCRNGALVGTCHCRMHSRGPKEAKPPRVRKEPKPKKIQPEHTHCIGESDPHCPLCETHGDCLDPTLPGHHFEGPDDLTARLREILSVEEVCGTLGT